MREAHDFQRECDSIVAILEDQQDAVFDIPTLFKNWTIKDIIGHLHIWNIAADQTLHMPQQFQNFIGAAMKALGSGQSHQQMQGEYFKGKSGRQLFEEWRAYYPNMAMGFAAADPDQRVQWAGPDMSTRSCIIARQMEHWAHAQAIFDVLGLEREDTDRLKNVAHIGVTTYSWSYRVNAKVPILPKPYVRLQAPSGKIWEWNEPQLQNRIEGAATQFCQVVTQCRNIGDTDLAVAGEAAKTWMDIAQCFAGGPQTPPAKGQRYREKGNTG